MVEGAAVREDKAIDIRHNSLDTFRLLAALSVMYTHGISHMASDGHPLFTALCSYFTGVPLFFALSGYLIWNSAGRQDLRTYFRKRFSRIYPELWLGVAVELAVLLLLFDGPVQWGSLGIFAFCQSTVFQFWTPDFLRSYGCGVPNGSLWTICTLVQFYILVYPFRSVMHGKKTWVWIMMIAGSVLLGAASPLAEAVLPQLLYKLYMQTVFPYLWMFMLGMFVGEKRDVIVPFLKKWWFLFAAASVVLFFSKWDIVCEHYRVLRGYSLILAVIGAAYRFPGIRVKKDISYGIYIYHMTVVNAMIVLGYAENNLHLFLMMAVSCALAYLSASIFGGKKNILTRTERG